MSIHEIGSDVIRSQGPKPTPRGKGASAADGRALIKDRIEQGSYNDGAVAESIAHWLIDSVTSSIRPDSRGSWLMEDEHEVLGRR